MSRFRRRLRKGRAAEALHRSPSRTDSGGPGSCPTVDPRRWRRRHRRRHSREGEGAARIAIVGNPNVGKSVIFNALTGAYATVSNYPGTTVEVSRGSGRFGEVVCVVIDTPGMYSLLPTSEDERVARSILLCERPAAVIHVVDAKNLQRMLVLTLELREAGFDVILVLNMMDEASMIGLSIDVTGISAQLGIPVLATVATTGEGIARLRQEVLTKLEPAVVQPTV